MQLFVLVYNRNEQYIQNKGNEVEQEKYTKQPMFVVFHDSIRSHFECCCSCVVHVSVLFWKEKKHELQNKYMTY